MKRKYRVYRAVLCVTLACLSLVVGFRCLLSTDSGSLQAVAVDKEKFNLIEHNLSDVSLDVPVENVVDNVENVTERSQTKLKKLPSYTEEELEILAIIIYQEAGGDGCSDETRRMVGSVFLNRVNSPLFPNSFEEVATARYQYGTLYITGIKWPDRASSPLEANAVQRAYDIAEELLINGSILPDNVIWQAEFAQGDGIYCYQDYTYFCYSEVN